MAWGRRMTPLETLDRELIKLVAAKHVAIGNLDYGRVSALMADIDDLLERRVTLAIEDRLRTA